MCGIAGFSLAAEGTSITDPAQLARTLAILLDNRGKDATGFGWWNTEEHDRPWYTKLGEEAMEFAGVADIPDTMSTCIVHTRHGTKGSAKDNANNHPVVAEGIVLVHNGVIYNDAELVKDLGSEKLPGEVDSRAIAHLLAFGPEVFGTDRAEVLLERIDGWASLAWLDYYHPDTLFLAKLKTSPLYVVDTRGGDLIFASTADHAHRAAVICGIELVEESGGYLKEGKLIEVRDGQITSTVDVKLPTVTKTTAAAKASQGGTVTNINKKDEEKKPPYFSFPSDAQVGQVVTSHTSGNTYIKCDDGWKSLELYNKQQADDDEDPEDTCVSFVKDGKTILAAERLAANLELMGWVREDEAANQLSLSADPKPSEVADMWCDADGVWHDFDCDCFQCEAHEEHCLCDVCSDRWWNRVENEDWEGILSDYNRRKELTTGS